MKNENNMHEDEIDLRELFMVLKRRRFFIIAFVAVVTASAVLYTLFKPATYTSRAQLQIEYNTERHENLIQSPLVKKKMEKELGEEKLSSSTVDARIKEDTSFIDIKASSGDPNTARSLADSWIQAYASYIIKLNQREIERLSNIVDSQQEEIEQYPKYRSMQKVLVDDYDLLGIGRRDDAWGDAEGKLLVEETLHPLYRELEKVIVRNQIKISRLKSEIKSLEYQASLPGAAEEAVRDSRNLKRNLLLTLAFSLLLAVFLSFFLEFAASLKEEKN